MENSKIATKNSIIRAACIIAYISEGVNSVTELANSCELSKATVHRLLKALVKAQLVHQDLVTRQYLLGRLFIQALSKPLITHQYLIRCADLELKRLATITQETIHLDILSGLYAMKLKSIPSTHIIRVVVEVEEEDYLHAGATGKVLLSQLNNKELRTALKHINLLPVTDNTVVYKDELMVQIKRIREQGYAITFGERTSGGVGISAPINNYALPAAITVLGPQDRVKPRIPEIVMEIKKSSAIVSENIKATYKNLQHSLEGRLPAPDEPVARRLRRRVPLEVTELNKPQVANP